MEKSIKFGIVSPTYNAIDWIRHHLQSVKFQKYKHYEHVVVDDRSTDGTSDVLESWAGQITYFKNDKHMGPAYSHWSATEYLRDRCDVIIHLDGDDWFLHADVLGYLCETYKDTNIKVTYGGYIPTDLQFPLVYTSQEKLPPREAIIKGWPYSHLRTFRASLAKHLNKEDLQDSRKQWLTSAADVAIMAPIIELAGLNSVVKTPLFLCQYNRSTAISEDKIKLDDQVRCAMEAASKSIRSQLV